MAELEQGLEELKVVKQAFKNNINANNVSTANVEFRDMPELLKQMEKKLPTQTKNVIPKTSAQTISADVGYKLDKVEVGAVTSSIDRNLIPTNIRKGTTILGVQGNLEADKPDQQKTVNPTTSTQVVVGDTGYELAKVTINPVTSSIDSNIKSSNIKQGVSILGVTGTLQEGSSTTITLQEKTIKPTTSKQSVIADAGYTGLSKVNVEAVIPSEYYKPEEVASVIPAINPQVITPSINSVFKQVNVSAVTSAIDTNIQSENIKEGISILGVVGSLKQSSGGSPKFEELVDGSILSLEESDISNITFIRDYAFAYCNNLRDVVIPNNIVSIGANAFQGTAIQTLTIPVSVTEIKENAFADSSLSEITMESLTPPSVTDITFPSTISAIYVKYGAYESYLAEWSAYADKIVRLPAIPSTITVIVNNYLGELVSGAEVTITGNDQTYVGTTNAQGVFTQGDLQPATYTISVADLDGFKTPNNIEVIVNENTENVATVTYLEKPQYVIYGVRIALNNSNPQTAVEYTDDAVGFSGAYMDFNNTQFIDNDWYSRFPFNQIKPCLFKDGQVVKYLNPNNYAQDIDGNAVDITSGNAGDVMIEIPKVYYYLHKDANYQYVQISDMKVDDNYVCSAHTDKGMERDKVYMSAYEGYYDGTALRSLSGKIPTGKVTMSNFRTYAENLGSGYGILYYDLVILLQSLYLIMTKNRNSQAILGYGRTDYTVSPVSSGSLNNSGLTFGGKSTSTSDMKFLGIEHIYGNMHTFTDGILTDNNGYILRYDEYNSDCDYNSSGTNYTKSEKSYTSMDGFIQDSIGDSRYGFIITSKGGSSTTYYTDGGYFSPNAICVFGGGNNSTTYAGMFFHTIAYGDVTFSHEIFGTRLVHHG